jgi:dipeptidyl aminopeptidase/acylaminoacyl peptidase
VILSGVLDLLDMQAKNDAGFNQRITRKVFGADQAELARHSPLQHFASGMPPLLIAIGEFDFPYLIPQAERAHERLQALGNNSRLLRLPDTTHQQMVLDFGTERDELTTEIAAFAEAVTRR